MVISCLRLLPEQRRRYSFFSKEGNRKQTVPYAKLTNKALLYAVVGYFHQQLTGQKTQQGRVCGNPIKKKSFSILAKFTLLKTTFSTNSQQIEANGFVLKYG